MNTFWEKVRHYANKKVRKQYMDRVRHDRECPNCKLWTSEVGGAHKVDYSDDKFTQFMTCRQCGYASKWDLRGMLPELHKDQNPHTPKVG